MPTLWIQTAFMPTWNVHVTVLECPQMKIIKDVLNSVWRALCFVWAVWLSCVRDAINWHVWILIIRPQLPNHCRQDDHTFHNLFCPPVQNHSWWQSLNYWSHTIQTWCQHLWHAGAISPASTSPKNTRDKQAKCGTCSFICTSTNITGPKSQMNITKQFNCLTYNTIYFSLHWDALNSTLVKLVAPLTPLQRTLRWYIKTLERETCC